MNVKQSLDLLMSRLARTAPELRAQALNELILAQEALEKAETLPYFILVEAAFTETTAGERRVPLPADFLRESDEQELALLDENDVRLREIVRGDYDKLMAQYGSEAEGPPERYCVRGTFLIVFPKPDDVYRLEFSSYYGRQEVPADSTESENAWFANAADLLTARAGLVMASLYLKDAELVSTFTGLHADAKTRLFHSEVAREEANRQRTMEDD